MSPLFKRVQKAVLPGWEISLAFVPAKTAQALNKRLRGRSYVPNVLAYEAGTKHGEVIISKAVARKEAPDYGLTAERFILLLFIHALLHLKGSRHGSTMERREWALLRRFAGALPRLLPTNGSPHRHGHRHRDLSGQDRRRRRVRR